MLYRMLTGRLPFDGTAAALIIQIGTRPVPPPSDHPPDLDPALERVLLRALALSPDDTHARRLYGKCLACRGRHAEAIAELRRAAGTDLGRHGLLLARRYDEAVAQFRKVLQTDPDFWLAHRFLGWAHLFQGRTAEGVAAMSAALRLDDNPLARASLGYACAAAGRRAEAEDVLAELAARSERLYTSPDAPAIVCIGLGDHDRAFGWLTKAVEDRSEWPCKVRVDPVLDPLRGDTRFAELVARLNVNE